MTKAGVSDNMRVLPTLRQLKFLVALADRRHFGGAANACLVSQSTLSAAIQELEEALGVTLFERTRRSVAPTSIGLEIAERARMLLKEAEDLVDAALASRDPMSGPLRLGLIPTIAPFLLPRVLPRLRKAAPRLKIYLREEQTAPLLERLEAGQVDAAIVALPAPLANVETEDLALDRFFVVCPRTHRLAGLAVVRPHDMATEDLLLLEDGHCMREHALAACALEGARRNVAFKGTSLHTLVMMAANGLGVTLVPEMALAAGVLGGFDLHAAPLEGDAPHRRIALAWRRTSGRIETFRGLAALLREAEGEDGGCGNLTSRTRFDTARPSQ
jgi:LysR family transcriptional regulator, hydrogen peroxide-inducible genes activator